MKEKKGRGEEREEREKGGAEDVGEEMGGGKGREEREEGRERKRGESVEGEGKSMQL
jgi:hypothetical protein